jgi:hypothetical protein
MIGPAIGEEGPPAKAVLQERRPPLRKPGHERRRREARASRLEAKLDQVELHVTQGAIQLIHSLRLETEAARARSIRKHKD